jgi:hypothetical protein
MTIVTNNEVESWVGASDGDTDVAVIHPSVENHIKALTRRDLELTTYTLERYDGTGRARLYLKNYPVTEVTICSSGVATAMTIENTATDTYSALVNIETDKIQLKLIGGAGQHDWVDFTFVANATITEMVNAIAAHGSDWTATLSSTDYAAYPCTLLIPVLGAPATSALSLSIPGAMSSFEVLRDEGILYCTAGSWPSGTENIIVSFKAGYSTIPDRLKLLILDVCKELYDRKGDDSGALKSYSLGDIRRELLEIFSRDYIRSIIASFKRPLI